MIRWLKHLFSKCRLEWVGMLEKDPEEETATAPEDVESLRPKHSYHHHQKGRIRV